MDTLQTDRLLTYQRVKHYHHQLTTIKGVFTRLICGRLDMQEETIFIIQYCAKVQCREGALKRAVLSSSVRV